MRNGQLSHSLLTGLFIDEHLARTAIATNGQTQSQAQLTDALGSVIALANAQTLSINTSYSYSPYGQTQSTGENSSNNQQYTGREAGVEGEAGLYYYRARYYDPVLKRFISEDPIGLSGGLNVYQYVEGDPVSLTDPSGKNPYAGAVAGAELGTLVLPGWGTVIGGGLGLLGGYLVGDALLDWMFSNPYEGEPDSCGVSPTNGQERKYGQNGKPEYDIDWSHDHGYGIPHGHNWSYPNGPTKPGQRGPGVRLSPWPRGRMSGD